MSRKFDSKKTSNTIRADVERTIKTEGTIGLGLLELVVFQTGLMLDKRIFILQMHIAKMHLNTQQKVCRPLVSFYPNEICSECQRSSCFFKTTQY